MSKIIESLRGDLAALQKAGAIDKVTMHGFDAISLRPAPALDAPEIPHMGEQLKTRASQRRPAPSLKR